MGVRLREVPGKGWYVFINYQNQRKAKFFGPTKADKRRGQEFADKLSARLKWAEHSGEPIALNRPDATMPMVKDYLSEWLRVYADAHCKPSTASGYRIIVEHHILPALGERRLHEVTRTDIKRLIASLVAQGRKKRTIHNILTPLKEAYQHAIDDDLVTVNPVVKMGRLVRSAEGADAHINPLGSEEVRLLLSTAREKLPLFYPVLLCAVRTGMRQGELLGLQWGDLDYHGQFLEVRRSIVRRQVTTTKTHKIRRVDMSPQLAAVLHVLQETRQLEASMKGQPLSEWVFLGPTGQRMSNELVRKAFGDCLTAAGLRRVRFHDLRHTFASLLIQQGANVKYIQQQLGHGSISITLDVYSHLFQGDHRHHVHSLDDPPENSTQREPFATETATQAQPTSASADSSMRQIVRIEGQNRDGGVTERPNVPVLKTGVFERGPRVQISPPPPSFPAQFVVLWPEVWLNCV
jgi:integrase